MILGPSQFDKFSIRDEAQNTALIVPDRKIMEALKKIIVVGAGHMGSAIALGLRRANSESSNIRILNDIQFRFSIIQMPGNPLKKV